MKNIAFCFGVAIMVILLNACSVGQDSVDSHIDSHTKKYLPQNRDELLALVRDNSVNLGDIDTSKITDMRLLFDGSERVGFSGIESWNTSNVVDMSNMFSSARFFNHNINAWNVSKVKNMRQMFFGATSFNQNLDSWNVPNCKNRNECNFQLIFINTPLQKNPPKWY